MGNQQGDFNRPAPTSLLSELTEAQHGRTFALLLAEPDTDLLCEALGIDPFTAVHWARGVLGRWE